jgi:hypothetical protein
MKLSFAPLAIAAAVAFASTTAHAALSTTVGTTPPDLTGLYISIWDTTTKHSELVNLSNEFSDFVTPGLITPDTAGGLFKAATVNGQSVLSMDFGVLPGFASTFGTPGATTSYMVIATDNNTGSVYTEAAGSPAMTSSGLGAQQQAISGQISNWLADPTVNTSGTAIDLTGSASFNAITGPNQGGLLGLQGFNFSGVVGTALNFFNTLKSGRSGVTNTEYANSTGNGFWFLSASGDLTWNVPTSGGAPVPVPAAVWLFMSGLAGLGAIGRRRVAA